MDPSRRQLKDSRYANLFDLEPLMNFRIPRHEDETDYYGSSSQDETRGNQGGLVANYGNGVKPGMNSSAKKRKRWTEVDDDVEDGDDHNYSRHVTEEHYRAMLGEHVQRFKSRSRESRGNHAPLLGVPVRNKSNVGINRGRNDHHRRFYDVDTSSNFAADGIPQRRGSYRESNITPKVAYEPSYLDIGEGVVYKIPPSYDKLVASLNLPSFSDIHVDDFYLKGALDLRSLAELMARDKRSGARSRNGMGEPRPQYDSLQARVKALSASNSSPNFSLKVSEDAMNSVIPEGAAGTTARTILSEGGVLQVHYVKVLEKGDTYEIVQRSLPKKLKVKNDPAVIEKAERDKIRKVWINIVRRDIPKHHRVFTTFHRKQSIDAKRFADGCQREVRMKVARSFKLPRSAPIRTRKISRDMLLFWKRYDKQMAEERKKQEKEAAEALKREQELREAQRQQQRLNFLIKQTELYSHFMQNKTDAMPSEPLPIGDENLADKVILEPSAAKLSEVEDPEVAKMKEDALKAAREAVSKQRKITDAFDTEYMKLQQPSDMEGPSIDVSVSGSGNIDLHNPSTMPVTSTVQTPEMFKGTLKEYQMKGLQWLVNCYEQGLNGILADEMGLGKTIQAMAFLAHLAEEKNIWGPFLVVAPASVLNNWADEISRFCPDLKTLPYWGGLQERTILRKNINPKRMYRRDAGFHILITSYQLLVTDEKYFRRVKWQYMVLDEAQAIKSSTSIRWKTLLSFNCRNRLLLTGTPIQNNMAELWALLHFIMPMVFDSHEQFNEWFSKGIENHAEHGGTLNEHQLNRLHAILKPFMLRRVKKDVVSELTTKTEVTVHCKLSSRQQAFYQAIKNKISLAELFDSNRGHFNEKKILNLMNIVIQLRKVCNHPELFERNEGSSYLYFGVMSNSLLPPPFGELEDVHYSGGQNPITYKIPKLLEKEMLQNSETFCSSIGKGLSRESFLKHFNIFSPEYIHRSTLPSDGSVDQAVSGSGAFGFSRLMDLSPSEVGYLALCSVMERLLFSILKWERQFLDEIVDSFMEFTDDDLNGDNITRVKTRAVTRMLLMPSKVETSLLKGKVSTGPTCHSFESLVISHQDRLLSNIKLLHSAYTFIPKARAPPVSVHCSDRNSAYRITEEMHQPWLKRLLIGFARTSEANGPRKPSSLPHPLIQEIDSELPVVQPALQLTHRIFGSCPPMQSFDPAKLLTDSGKLQTLDILLKRLRAGNHRVLLFAQMTKMLNILEDYMNYRKYKYLRLDGSSTIMDRRDMVRDFQQRSDIFVFLLSTRAGGLGINLTAADTVIFYESDWNPTLDLQAMDRAHRLGQTKDVTVYRLICKETVEEKILHRASQKNTVQQLVMTGGHVQGDDVFGTADVVSLLMDDAEAAQLEQKFRELPLQVKDRQKKKQPMKRIRIDAEGDAALEELDDATERQDNGEEPADQEPENTKPSNKKRKAASTPRARVPQKAKEDENGEGDDTPLQPQRTKRVKRQTKSINESLEPVFSASVTPTNGDFNPSTSNADG
ncbi:DNA helicase INO80 [Raphanus sativus]|uniref:Chromatin-remodeling ATPase INO80 n=1 Tax=Raphanus sativus TaxID=3726 RepID=A0A6J0P832_RAPSA|nr:chromatin-remodeling ATPase INO80 isoform X1 [Raphanus sativus]KAJ4896065.1 DNA helicase INO80 [Raphanus sativus]